MGGIKLRRILLHILFWVVYIPLNAALVCLIQNISVYEYFWTGVKAELYLVPVKMIFVYFIFYAVIPLYLERNKPLVLISVSLMGFLGATILYRLVDSYIYLPTYYPDVQIEPFELVNMILAMFDLFITTSAALTVKMVRMRFKSLEYEQELVKEKLNSELDFLRAQTNPHFLFNTLNNLYGLARKKNEKTPEAILMLSKILRFMLYDCRVPRIQVAGEVRVIKDYIELEKLRYNDRLKVIYEEDVDNPGTLIAPLLLLPFIENSFKHGAHSTVEDASIHIKVFLENNHLDFTVENTFDPETVTRQKDSSASGIGLRNSARQLELIYPEKHTLTNTAKEGWYRTHLHIDLSGDNF